MAKMDAEEREALTAYLEECSQGITSDEQTTRQAMGVLRRLWPEYYEQLKPRRGRKANNELCHLVISRFTMLTDRRMRDDNAQVTGTMGRPYTPSEAITKIARENHISEDYVRELTEAMRAEQKAEQKQNIASQAQLMDEARERKLLVVLECYEQAFREEFFNLKIKVNEQIAFEKYLEDAHTKATQATVNKHGVLLEEVVLATQIGRRKIVEELRKRRAAYFIKMKIDIDF